MVVTTMLGTAVMTACSGGDDPRSSTTSFDPPGLTAGTATSPTSGPSPGTDSNTTGTDSLDSGTTGAAPSCCQVSPSPGCGNMEIQTCVCTIEPSCCQQVWSEMCVELAAQPCGDPGCDDPPSTTTQDPTASSGDPPTLTCEELAQMQNFVASRCEVGGNNHCNGMGTPTVDCDWCCEICGQPDDQSCGDLATANGWAAANCEWNDNGACGGQGTPTCDCDVCCQAG